VTFEGRCKMLEPPAAEPSEPEETKGDDASPESPKQS
jgi:hypothetical protein